MLWATKGSILWYYMGLTNAYVKPPDNLKLGICQKILDVTDITVVISVTGVPLVFFLRATVV
jgi:hypothetical protein